MAIITHFFDKNVVIIRHFPKHEDSGAHQPGPVWDLKNIRSLDSVRKPWDNCRASFDLILRDYYLGDSTSAIAQERS